MARSFNRPCLVAFQPSGLRIEVERGSTVLESARAVELPLAADCGGNGTCGRCVVRIPSGEISPASGDEVATLGLSAIGDGERLACRARVLGDISVEIPESSLVSGQVLEIGSAASALEVDTDIELPAGSEHPLGLAVDLGSTKIAAYLLDMKTGREVSAGGAMNPQLVYGEDIISRLTYACRNEDGLEKLGQIVRKGLGELAATLLSHAGAEPRQVVDVCLVGNTVMTHMFLGLPVETLAVAPFQPFTLAPAEVKASAVGLDFAPGASVHVLPAIGGFVGADHVAMILGADMDRSEKICLGLDLGTNTEIVLCDPRNNLLAATSCASGPAFEGAHIRHGMRAAPGAISKVRFDGLSPSVETVGGETPVGLCGSGIIDAIAGMLDTGIVNTSGHLEREAPGVRECKEGYEYVLLAGHETGNGREIVIAQGDISEIQLAKGAIYAAATTLLEEMGVAPEEVREVHLAGAFGSRFNLESVLRIGLLPRFDRAAYSQIGNAAGLGARKALLSKNAAKRAGMIAGRARFVDLKENSSFNRRLARALRFPGC